MLYGPSINDVTRCLPILPPSPYVTFSDKKSDYVTYQNFAKPPSPRKLAIAIDFERDVTFLKHAPAPHKCVDTPPLFSPMWVTSFMDDP